MQRRCRRICPRVALWAWSLLFSQRLTELLLQADKLLGKGVNLPIFFS